MRITNTGTSQTQQRVTNSSGYFEAVLLNPGAYEVRVELQGYKALSQSGISLAVGQTVNLTLTLEVGPLSEQIEGDFSDLLLLPSGRGPTTPATHHQYQIYDPLTTRPDPLRPGRVIRDPFPNNIIPKDRFMNPDGT